MEHLVTWHDARAVFRLLDELKQLGNDPLAWRTHLLTELGALVGASVFLGGEAPTEGVLTPAAHAGSVDGGWATDSDRHAWMAACGRTEPNIDPMDRSIAALGATSYTRPRHDLATNADWYRSVIYNEHYRPAGIDHCLLSNRFVPQFRLMHYMIFVREFRRPRFSDRDRTIVHGLHRELGAAWKTANGVALPRRLEQTLDWLERGASEKEIAAHLGIGQHTVHTYCKLLHKRFEVRSRGELLARAKTRPRAPLLVLSDRRPTTDPLS